MPKILFINSVCYGSTGKICLDLYNLAMDNGFEACIAYGRGYCPKDYNTIKIGNKMNVYSHAFISRLLDNQGFNSKLSTYQLIKRIKEYNPDIIHMHNIHGYYVNIEVLFDYLKTSNVKVVWTLHDCWSFTGHCAHYLSNNCNKWINDCCYSCEYKNEYPSSLISQSQKNFLKKKDLFLSIKDKLTLVCVSDWLKQEVSKSFLSNVDTRIIKSGINIDIFRRRESNLKKKLGLENKRMILGVSSVWNNKKGLNDFIELSRLLDDDYRIVLVGLTAKQIKNIPENIIGLPRTNTQIELAEIYSSCDIFFNPTKEESYGLTNVEAQACGATVVSYDSGGTSETLKSKNSYLVKDLNEFLDLLERIDDIRDENMDYSIFDKDALLNEYCILYKELLKDDK